MSADAMDVAAAERAAIDIEAPTSELLQQLSGPSADNPGREVVVRVPAGTAQPNPGVPLLLRWMGERGIYSFRAEMLAVGSVAPRASWTVRLVGELQMRQRREFARTPYSGPVAIVPIADGPVAVVKGEITDLSEGGLRARLQGPLSAGGAVEVHLAIDGAPTVLSGTVLRSDALPADGQLYETVVVFLVQEAQATRLRRMVLRQQMLARKERQS